MSDSLEQTSENHLQSRRFVDLKIEHLESSVADMKIVILEMQKSLVTITTTLRLVAGILVLVVPIMTKWNLDLSKELQDQGKILAAHTAVLRYQLDKEKGL